MEAKVMFLDNSLISLSISNGSTGIVTSVMITGLPKVTFPTVNGIEVAVLELRYVEVVGH